MDVDLFIRNYVKCQFAMIETKRTAAELDNDQRSTLDILNNCLKESLKRTSGYNYAGLFDIRLSGPTPAKSHAILVTHNNVKKQFKESTLDELLSFEKAFEEF